MSSSSTLTAARYGKTNVRVFRVVREGSWHTIVEYNVEALLEGDIATSYTEADNSVVVATDSIKNITYYLAKISPHILSAEKFGLHLGTFLVSKYAHITKAFVTVTQLRWTRVRVAGSNPGSNANANPGNPNSNANANSNSNANANSDREGHPHAFYRDGEDKRVVKIEVDASAGKDKLIGRVTAGISDLLVLKSTGSSFTHFIRDEYTTLAPAPDRIFSTAVELCYTFADVVLPVPTDERGVEFVVPVPPRRLGKGEEGNKGEQGQELEGEQKEEDEYEGSVWDEAVPVRARTATLEVFAVDESASVQATLYKMAQRIIAENAGVQRVSYALPNKHYVPVDMAYLGVDNLTPANAEVFIPLAHPSGLITATVSRK